MAIKAKISLDKSELSQGLNQAKQEAQSTGQQIQGSLSSASNGLAEASKSAGKFTSALQAVSRVAGGLGSDVASMAAGFVKAMKTPVTAILAIVAALVALGAKLYEVFSKNTEEAVQKAEFELARIKKLLDLGKKQEQEYDAYLARLREINKMESISIETKKEAIELVRKLNERYKGLGLSVTEEGKILGLDEAKGTKSKEDYERTLNTAMDHVEAVNRLLNEKLQDATGGLVTDSLNDQWDNFTNYSQVSHLDKARDFWKMAFTKPGDAWSGKGSTPYEAGLEKYNAAASWFLKRKKEAEDSGEWGDLHSRQRIYNEFYRKRAEGALAISKAVSGKDIKKWQEIATTYEELAKAYDTVLTIRETGGYETDAEHAEAMKKESTEAEEKRQAELEKQKQKEAELARYQEQANTALQKAVDEAAELKGRITGADFTDDAIRRRLGINPKNKEFWDSDAGKKAFADVKAAMLKAAGLKLQSGLVEQGTDLRVEARKALGMEKEAMEMKALKAAEKQKGFALTDKEKDLVKQFTSIQYQVSKLQRPGEVAYTGTMTNELAARGGFSSSVVTDTKEDINRQIFDIQKQSKDLLADIDEKVKKLGVIE